ncbi:hypothetical protein A4A49_60914, partial [Nicotiana attenuata]
NMFNGREYITNLEVHYNGRIWLTWSPDYFQVSVINVTAQAVTCRVTNICEQTNYIMTIVYEYNSKEERKEFWSYLRDISQRNHMPWLIVGDFNTVLKQDDRIGGNPIIIGEIIDFHDCMEECGLIEIPQSGSRYTWSDRHERGRIWSKIDCVFVKIEWLDTMHVYSTKFLLEGITDHSPVIIAKVISHQVKRRKPFMFCNTWSQHPEFLNKVKETWRQQINEGIEKKTERDRDALERTQIALQQCLRDQNLQREEAKSYQKFRHSSYMAELYLQQRSKATRLQQAITQVQDKYREVQTDQESIAGIMVDFYKELLGKKENQRTKTFNDFLRNGNVLTISQQLDMLKPYTEKDVKKIMFSIDKNKNSGPDGYGGDFFKAAWTIIWGDVTTAILEFF